MNIKEELYYIVIAMQCEKLYASQKHEKVTINIAFSFVERK